jgi:SagB-type dehydrogenase family enzyme
VVVPAEVLYRRAVHIVCYWKHGRFLFHNYGRNHKTPASPIACEILDACTNWRSLANVGDSLPTVPVKLLRKTIEVMVREGLLHRSDRKSHPRELAMSRLDRWNPEAGFFHTSTRDVPFLDKSLASTRLKQQARTWPMPSPVKRYRGTTTVDLAAPSRDGSVAEAFLARRSWRNFGSGTIPLKTFGGLLGLTAGVQKWVKIPGIGRVAFKTSPSGGARHPVEVYVLAWGIEGLRKGLYHYEAGRHRLALVRPRLDGRRVPEYLPEGDYWTRACAVLLFTAVYERHLWRYPYSRAYRASLIEAGHLCQTFCVLATSYGLAPFCAMGLADSKIERDLGIDGVTESVLYAAGIGVLPEHVAR